MKNNNPIQLMHNGMMMKRITGRNHRTTMNWFDPPMSIPPPYVIGKVTVKNILVDSRWSSGLLHNFVHKYISKSSNRAVYFYNSNDIKPL